MSPITSLSPTLALTARAAKRWKIKHSTLPPLDSGGWVVDLLKLGKGPLLVLLVHQETLFTLVRLATEVKSPEDVASEIAAVWDRGAPSLEVFYKNADRRVTGSITDMKFMLRFHARYDGLPRLEERINDCPFSAIGMDHPRDRFEKLRRVE